MISKRIFRILVLAGLLLCQQLVPAQAQGQRRTPEEMAQMQTEWMQKNLSLTDDQNKKVTDINSRFAKTLSSADKSDRRQIMATKDSEIKNVLTADQYKTYEAHMQEMREKMRTNRGNMQNGN